MLQYIQMKWYTYILVLIVTNENKQYQTMSIRFFVRRLQYSPPDIVGFVFGQSWYFTSGMAPSLTEGTVQDTAETHYHSQVAASPSHIHWHLIGVFFYSVPFNIGGRPQGHGACRRSCQCQEKVAL